MAPLPPSTGNPAPGAPPRPKPKSKRIVWHGTSKPSKKIRSKYKVGKAGSGKYKGKYVALRKPKKPKTTPRGPTVGNGTQVGIGPGNTGSLTPPAAPAAPAGPTGPYSELPEWARNYMLGFDTQAQHHQNYVTGQVMPWLSEALKGVGQFSEAAQAQIQNTGNAGAGALQVAANAGTPNVAPVAPGAGPIQGDQAYQLNAANTAAGAISGAMVDRNKYNADMSRFGLQNQSSAVLTSMGQFAAGLPAAYSQRRNERLLEIRNYVERERQFNETQARLKYQYDKDMALAQERFKEDQRRYGIEFAYRQFNDARSAAISQLNAQNQLILGLGSLGLKGTELAAELGNTPGAPPTNLPVGFTVVPTDDGGYEVVRDPTVPQATEGGGGAGGGPQVDTRPFKQGTNGWFIQNGWKKVRDRKHLEALRRHNIDVQKSVDGSGVWFKPKSGSGGGGKDPKPSPYKITGDPNESFVAWYADNVNGKFSPTNARVPVSNWLNFNKRYFTDRAGLVNEGKLIQFLDRNIGDGGEGVPDLVLDYLRKTFFVKRGKRYAWKP